MVRESEAPGMYLSSRSKAAAAAMLGGVRGADGGGGERVREDGRFIKDVGVNRTQKKKSGTTPGDDAANSSKNNSGTILGLSKYLRISFRTP